MQRGIGSRARGLLATVIALTAFVALPAVASAGTATSGSGVQYQRDTFMRYMYGMGFGGTVSATGTATFAVNGAAYDDDTLTHTFDGTNTTYAITRTAGSGTLALSGGISYQMPAHFINVTVSDPRVAITSPTAGAAIISAVVSYDPLESGTQIRNPTTPTRIDAFRVNLGATGVFGGTGGTTHTWTRAPAVLTAAGANAFNGGGNGSYSDGSVFGSWTLSATTPRF